jgi:N6-L-threonylcarbamoyladenine synthase
MTCILGIETSCDETAAAVVEDGTRVRSNIIATQHDLHARYAGVVPEIASRAHLERITPVIREAMRAGGVAHKDLHAVAVGHRPGLIGSLLVGVSAAKAMAWALGVPLIGVDHVLAHLHAGLLESPAPQYPGLGLVVSGGHTSLFLVRSGLDVELLGKTIDDAVGEAYDKAATILGLGYPGGPALDRLAQQGDDRAHALPVTMLAPESLDFSFSGLKTALLYAVRGQPVGRGEGAVLPRDPEALSAQEKADFAASFQRAAVTAVMRKLTRALAKHSQVKSLLVGGGVSANSRLRRDLQTFATNHGLDLRLPKLEYCVDNAAMIAGAAMARFTAGQFDDLALAAAAQSAFHV